MYKKLVLLTFVWAVYAGCHKHWEGTAPFCNSDCPRGEKGTGIFSSDGDGGHCFTGRKQICAKCASNIPDSGPCNARPPTCECKFLDPIPVGVMICDGGCGKYATGPCFQIPLLHESVDDAHAHYTPFADGSHFDIVDEKEDLL